MYERNTRITVRVEGKTTIVQLDQSTDSRQPTNAIGLAKKADVLSFIKSLSIFIIQTLRELIPFLRP